jgi:hypothetical protein
MHIKPMIAAAVLSAGFAAVAMGAVTTPSTQAGVSAPSLHLAQATDTATKATKKSHKKKAKKTTATDTMSAPK